MADLRNTDYVADFVAQDFGDELAFQTGATENDIPADHHLRLTDPATGTIPNSSDINEAQSYSEKTIALEFETGADVSSRQVIYEQGGGTRGISVSIHNGELHLSIWNFAEENWGFKEVSIPVTADTTYTTALVFEGNIEGTGSITGYLNGEAFGTADDVGLLYTHANGVGIGNVNSNTVVNGDRVSGSAAFEGEISEIVAYNRALSSDEIAVIDDTFNPEPGPAPVPTPEPGVELPEGFDLRLTDPTVDSVRNSADLNVARSYDEKTIALEFAAGDDVNSLQVLYEQGGGERGISVYIKDGQLHMAIWNTKEENWGYREVSVDIEPGQTYTSALVFDGNLQGTGTFTGFLNGVAFETATDVGLLYAHGNGIGIGQVNSFTRVDGERISGPAEFQGTLSEVISYNRALSDQEVADMDAYLNPAPIDAPDPDPTPEPDPEPEPAPEAVDDAFTISENATVVLNVLDNDGVSATSTLEILATDNPDHGNITINDDGTLTYVHNGSEAASDTFRYVVRDQDGVVTDAVVSLTIENVNDAPVVTVADISVAENATVGDVLTEIFATDAEGDDLFYSLGDNVDQTLFDIDSATGNLILKDALDYETQTQHTITVDVSDGQDVTTRSFQVNVTDVDETPRAPDEPGREDRPNIIAILDTGYLPNAPRYEPLIDEWGVVSGTRDATSGNSHGTVVEKSIYDITSGYEDIYGTSAIDGVIHIKITSGNSGSTSLSNIERAFQYVESLTDTYDVVAANLSFGTSATRNTEWIQTSSLFDEYRDLTEGGTAITISAGNSGTYGTNFLASTSMDGVFAVSALNTNGSIARYSDEGDFTDYYALGRTTYQPNEDSSATSSSQGTSFAAPRVAGLVGVVQDLAEDTLDRLLDMQELTSVFDNVADSIIGKFTGEAINTLTLENVLASFENMYGDNQVAGNASQQTVAEYLDTLDANAFYQDSTPLQVSSVVIGDDWSIDQFTTQEEDMIFTTSDFWTA